METARARRHRAPAGSGAQSGRRAARRAAMCGSAIQQLDAQGRVHEIADRDERLAAIAREYLRHPDGTLVVVARQSLADGDQPGDPPGEASRGQVARPEQHVRVLVARQEVTGADRQWAEHYQPAMSCATPRAARRYGLAAGEYARVAQVNATDNLVTVARSTGRASPTIPAAAGRHALSRGRPRVRDGRPRPVHRARPGAALANRELGTIERCETRRPARVRLDSGRTDRAQPPAHPHLDYGYAVTSSQQPGTDRRPRARAYRHRDARENRSSIGAWRTSPSRGVGTTRRSTPTTRRSSPPRSDRDVSHRIGDRAHPRPGRTRADESSDLRPASRASASGCRSLATNRPSPFN